MTGSCFGGLEIEIGTQNRSFFFQIGVKYG